MYKILLQDGDKNDATSFYLDIIKDAIILSNNSVDYITSLDDIKMGDDVIGITPKAYWDIKKQKRAHQILHWFQGVTPEEVDFYDVYWLKKLLSKMRYAILEKQILKHSDFNFFVSNTMLLHYRKKYGYSGNNYFVMPCFNQPLLETAFFDEKYSKPSFVYTGNLAKWQCFEPMVALFKQIKQQLPNATLTIYTKEDQKAQAILNNYGIDADIKYVPYQQLSEEIKQYKYGFILREDNVVNNVATPTKMNSYLASGIIPIYTDVVGAYKEHLSGLQYAIPVQTDNKGIEKLFELEKQTIQAVDVLHEYREVFDSYYNRQKYVEQIAEVISKLKK